MYTYHDEQNRTRKKPLGYVCVILSSKIFKVACITKKTAVLSSCFFLLILLFRGFFFALNSIVSVQGLPQCLKSYLLGAKWQVPLLLKKQENQPKCGVFVTRFDSLSLVVTHCTTQCHSLCYSLSFFVTQCIARLSFVVKRQKNRSFNTKSYIQHLCKTCPSNYNLY